ncbi:MAG TPA: tRNA (adenosine(37)-N6)-threonylcarbamoyltransferase complex dimerization subunit type 1 TsaB, partial [bacterium]|nr:tRNA (adenosine(37)-N6)-threonylcarbamoyltransferase complex dimerization subunit type 1 TsaB [bacterium]
TQAEELLAGAGLEPAALDVFIVAKGPGSFTGTRIGLAVALTLAQVTGRPVVGVDSLNVLAAQAEPAGPARFHVLLNCARDEVYHAPYARQGDALVAQAPIALTNLALAVERIGSEPALLRRFEPAQPGLEPLLARLNPMPLRHPWPDARLLLEVGLREWRARPGGPFTRVEPIYLKSEAFRTWRPNHERPGTGH